MPRPKARTVRGLRDLFASDLLLKQDMIDKIRRVCEKQGNEQRVGTVFGGGRHDDLVERFTGKKVPATAASAGVDMLPEAVKLLASADRPRLPAYFEMAQAIRQRGHGAQVYLGAGRIGRQVKYADSIGIPLAVIAGEDEFVGGEVKLKDLRTGAALPEKIADREEWTQSQRAQRAVKLAELADAADRAIAC